MAGLIGLYAMLALGLNIVVGFAGLLDLGYVAFYGIGSYAYAVLASPQFNLHFNFWIALLIAIALASLSGIIIGGPTLRLRGDYIAIVTLGFGEISYILMINLDRPVNITNGVNGILGIDPPTVLGHNVGDDLTLLGLNLSSTQQYFYLILAFVLVVLFLSYRLRDSRLGRAWVAIREDEDAAQAMGINTTQAKLLAYCLGASTAGITGAISAGWSQSVYPDSFLFTESLNVLAMVILGGMGSIPGAILGAAALVGLPEIFREFQMFRMLVYSLVLIAVMIYRPQGILGSERVRHELMPEEAAAVPELAAGDVAGGGK
ncbi:MAG: branched-chain amino acid ABC transporter permease [Chloroflexota bacterium]